MQQSINHERPSETSERLQGLLELSRSTHLCNGNFDLFMKELLISIANQVCVSRVSFWKWQAEEKAIVCRAMYRRDTEAFSFGNVLHECDYPRYFQSFRENLIIAADHARADLRTSEFTFAYLIPNDIHSMLDVQVVVNGTLFGVLCLEHTGKKRKWKKQDELHVSTAAAYLAQSYVISLQRQEAQLRRQSEDNFEGLFRDGPIPMWVFDTETLQFLDVNKEAISRYGYSKEEFLAMNILDIRPYDQQSKLFSYLQDKDRPKWMKTKWEHQYKDGTIIQVEIVSDWTTYNGKKARLVLAINKDQENELQKAKEVYYQKLNDYAFYASHNLRGPVATVLGLIELLQLEGYSELSVEEAMHHLKLAANKLDSVIGQLNSKVDLEDL